MQRWAQNRIGVKETVNYCLPKELRVLLQHLELGATEREILIHTRWEFIVQCIRTGFDMHF
jgi:hypothetical protein